MGRKMCLCLIILCSGYTGDIVKQSRAIAEEWRFLPGDAYFESSLTQKMVDEMATDVNEAPLVLQYKVQGDIRHQAGYAKLEIGRFSIRRRQMLAEVYKRIRKIKAPVFEITVGEKEELRREVNGLALLIYNKDFDYRRFAIGLRYNEDWADDGAKFASMVDFVNYYSSNECNGAGHIIEDWRNSKRVRPLNVTFPVWKKMKERELQAVPLEVASSDIICIVSSESDLERVRTSGVYEQFSIVEEDEVFSAVRFEDGWEIRSFEMPAKKESE